MSKTFSEAKKQLEDKRYAASLIVREIPEEKIYSHGFVFDGMNVLIG